MSLITLDTKVSTKRAKVKNVPLDKTMKVEDDNGKVVDLGVLNSSNVFAQTVIKAFADHKGLHLRPDDFWLSIFHQFSGVVNENVELFRDVFTTGNMTEKKIIRIFYPGIPFDQIPINDFVSKCFNQVTENLSDNMKHLICDFTTSTPITNTCSLAIFGSAVQNYYDFRMNSMCGFPFIELGGYREDWEELLTMITCLKTISAGKIDSLSKWLDTLVDVFTRILASYDNPAAAESKQLWDNFMCKNKCNSGHDSFANGWFTLTFYSAFLHDKRFRFGENNDGTMTFLWNELPTYQIVMPFIYEGLEGEIKKKVVAGPIGCTETPEHGFRMRYFYSVVDDN